ncbi:hypothetical protein ABZ312_09970 [Streptomyces sp. NPDC006207]
MTFHASPQYQAGIALAELVVRVPELDGTFDWAVTSDGRIVGKREHLVDGPGLVARVAEVIGGTPVTTTYERGADLARVTDLQSIWRGVHFDVWESSPAPGSDVAARLRAQFAGDYPAELIPTGGNH